MKIVYTETMPGTPIIDKKILERGYWIATHRLAIEKWISIILYLIIAAGYLTFVVHFGMYVYGYKDWGELIRRAATPVLNWSAIHARYAPQDLVFGDPIIFSRGNGRYDFFVEAQNPNETWAVESLR